MLRMLAISGLLVASACAGTVAERTVAIDTSVGPGTGDPAPAKVARLFDRACIATLPDYSGAEAVLTAEGLVQASTGTYFDTTDNLSVKLIGSPPSQCSVVWGVRGDARAALTGFRDALKAREPLDLSTSEFAPASEFGGATYFNTRTTAK